MEGVLGECPALDVVRDCLTTEHFTYIDIGCSGGIDPIWRKFGARLRAVGLDPNMEECARLKAQESNPNVEYVAGYVGLPEEHSFSIKKRGKSHWGRVPWDRLSIARTIKLKAAAIERMSSEEKTNYNFWGQTALADPNKPIYLPEYFRSANIGDIDFIKLDIDGADFDALHSLRDTLDSARVLGFGMEVNFHGSDDETEHTFHNTDRFMKASGFELFFLTTRPYSMAALPARYLLDIPAQSEFGRPLQGDALYVRDICNPDHQAFVARLSDEKILKVAGIFAVFNLPDCAAEILLKFRDRLSRICDVGSLLDILAVQAQPWTESKLSYEDYVAQFEADSDLFYRPRSGRAAETRLDLPVSETDQANAHVPRAHRWAALAGLGWFKTPLRSLAKILWRRV